jgi:sugar O-acyltransferase (sialic acid O-acetyltransferase NeuD family)
VSSVEALYVAGTGSWSAEVVEYAQAAGRPVLGLVELIDAGRVGTEIAGVPVRAIDDLPPPGERFIVLGVGSGREEHRAALEGYGWQTAAPIVHPSAVLSPSAQLAAGTVVGPAAVIGALTVIDAHVVIGRGALIGHHVRVGELAVINPGANVGGNATLGPGAQIGMGATVINGTDIAARAVVAAGAVVVASVEAGIRVQGVPARRYAA